MYLSPTDAAELTRHVRLLRRDRKISHATFSVFDALFWSCRRPGASDVLVSYTRLQDRAGACRQTIADAVRRLERLGVLSIERRRKRVLGANRQDVSRYAFRPITESVRPTVPVSSRIFLPGRFLPASFRASAGDAWDAVRIAIEARLRMTGRDSGIPSCLSSDGSGRIADGR